MQGFFESSPEFQAAYAKLTLVDRLFRADNIHEYDSLALCFELARDVNPKVRAKLAKKRFLPEEVYKCLAKDADASVRFEVADNYHAPESVLKSLCKDTSLAVSESAKDTFKWLQENELFY